jgi:hypothetical protein
MAMTTGTLVYLLKQYEDKKLTNFAQKMVEAAQKASK